MKEMNVLSEQYQGTLSALGSGFLFGILGLFTVNLFDTGASVTAVLAIRFAVTAILFTLVTLKLRSRWRLSIKQKIICLMMGSVGYTGQAGLFFLSIQSIGSGLANILLYLYPVCVVLIHSIQTRHLPKSGKLMVIASSLIGVVLICDLSNSRFNPLGVLAGMGAAVWYSCYLKVGEKTLKGISASAVAYYVFWGSALTLCGLALLNGSLPLASLDSNVVMNSIGLSVVGTLLPVMLMFNAMKCIGAVQASILSMVEPVVMILVGLVFLGEKISGVQISGIFLILMSVLCLQVPAFYWQGIRKKLGVKRLWYAQ